MNIDPPYNTGARDWKYNNDYVDGSDAYRHSKWLSFMEKRLKLAKKLLNPKDAALIVTIDEKTYLHLGCLLEEHFSEANIQMVNTKISAIVGVHDAPNKYTFMVLNWPTDESANHKNFMFFTVFSTGGIAISAFMA